MFLPMRHLGAKIAVVVALGCGCAAAAATASSERAQTSSATTTTTSTTTTRTPSKPPTPAQVRAAVAKAERSKKLWSTVNICNTKHHPDTIGIRGQMPSLSFRSSLFMQVQVTYWNYKAKKFEPDPGVQQWVSLGDPANEIVQGGALFKFKPPAVLAGTVTFEWKLHGKVVGSEQRATGGGHKNAKFGDPPGYSSNDCTLKEQIKK
jgi:hypothetical protein